MLICILDHGDGSYQVNLTDREQVFERRQHPDAGAALARVQQLVRLGHRPAFTTALAALVSEVEADRWEVA